MASTNIAQEISRLTTAKADLKTAIEGKGVTVPSSTLLDGYADLVDQIQQGGAEEAPENEVNFYDYTGFRVASYSIAEAKALTALPTPPSHEGLTFEGWNWSLADIQSYNRRYIDIGANYAPTDGKCHIKVHIPYNNFEFAIDTSSSDSTATTFDWGDGTTSAWAANLTYHTYTLAGDYDITIYPSVATNNLYLNLLFGQDVTITAPSTGLIQEVNVAPFVKLIECMHITCVVSLPATAIRINGFSSVTPVVAFPRAVDAIYNLSIGSDCSGIISFPKSVTKVSTNPMNNCVFSRFVFPEYTDGSSFGALTSWSLCKVLSLPLSFKYTYTNQLVYFRKLRHLDIVEGWIPSNNMNLSGSNYWLTQSLVDFFTKLGTTSTTITITLGTTNLNKLTADQKAIATNKGYTLA